MKKVKKIINKTINVYKNYKPSKQECLLFFLIPLFISTFTITLSDNPDIWFLLKHGEYVLQKGFPHIDFLSMHQGLHFVMQQWLSSVLFYIFNLISGRYGLYILCFTINCLILFFLYKLCMELSNNNYRVSTALAILTDFLLLLFRVIIPRPQIFTYLLLIITLYIMEKFRKNSKSKAIYFLPLISILQINFHCSMYFILYIFMLPYLIDFLIFKIKNKKDNRIFKLLIIWIVMISGAFINPYGIKALTYIFTSYNVPYLNDMISEMMSIAIDTINGKVFFSLQFGCIAYFICLKKGKFSLRQALLYIGLTFLALKNYRNIPLWIIGSIPFLLLFSKPYLKLKKSNTNFPKLHYVIPCFFGLVIVSLMSLYNQNGLYSPLKKGVDKLLINNNPRNVRLYTNFVNGSYVEYRGLKPYIDTRSEVFLKANNKKDDILKEYYFLYKGGIYYKDFMNKYNFTHALVQQREPFFNQIINDKDWELLYYGKCENKYDCKDNGDYVILERVSDYEN